jgi:NitT/TauT family transport system substrate-binding protein
LDVALHRISERVSWLAPKPARLALLLVPFLVEPGFGAQREANVLRLGYFPNITHAQALYARATGEFEARIGVRIEWTAFNAGPTAIESLFANAVDASFVGPSPTINGYIKSRGEKFVIVAGSAGGGSGLVVRKDSGIRSEKDFADKTIATPQLGNSQDVAARVWLAEKGYRLRERGGNVSLVPLSNPDQLTLFKKHQIDGAWTVEPWLSRLELEGGGQMLLEEKSLWPGEKFVTTHLVVSRNFLADNQQMIRKLVAALVEVTEQINSKDDVIQKAMTRVEFTWDPHCASLKQSAEALHRIGFLRTAPALNGIYALTLLKEVLKEKNLPALEAPSS